MRKAETCGQRGGHREDVPVFLHRLLLRRQLEDSEPQRWTLTCPTSPVSKASSTQWPHGSLLPGSQRPHLSVLHLCS